MNAQKIPSATSKSYRALLVDDDKFMLTVVGDMLRGLGASSVTTAENGTAALAAYERLSPPPDIVVCDLNMPDSDGFQFMEALAAKGYKGGIVLVSGMDARTMNSASLMARFHRLNILAALAKPVDEAALGRALAALNG
jgi:CheY-like chemotaxis protein